VRFARHDLDELARVDVEPLADLGVHARDALGCLDDPRTVRVLADAFEDQPHAVFDLLEIHRVARHSSLRA
jgi:hypothetical protein